MSITVESPFIAPARISEAVFSGVLARAGSPWADRAGALYDLIVDAGQDPAVWLAIAGEESTFGTNRDSVLWRNDTRSWTNARTVRDPSLTGWSIVRDAVRGSDYVRYADVLDSVRDGLYRITDPTYRYVQEHRASIGQVFAIWTEGNGATYAASVVKRINQWIAADTEEQPVSVDISGFTPPVIVGQWFAPNGVSYLGETMDMWGVCIHETGNTSPGSEAQQNVNYMRSPGCIARQASWHATVGLGVIIETIPANRQAFHASDGDGPGNTHFLAIEGVMCYPAGSPEFQRVMLNHAWYAAKQLHERGLPVTPIVQDADWSPGVTLAQHNSFARDNKPCPQVYRDNGLWPAFVEYTRAFYATFDAAPPAPAPDPNARLFEHPDYGNWWVINLDTPEGHVAMYDGWQDGGELAGWGYPLGPMERHADGVFRQPFEDCIGEIWVRGFDGKSAPLIRKGGLPQNWNWYSAFVEPIVAKWRGAA